MTRIFSRSIVLSSIHAAYAPPRGDIAVAGALAQHVGDRAGTRSRGDAGRTQRGTGEREVALSLVRTRYDKTIRALQAPCFAERGYVAAAQGI